MRFYKTVALKEYLSRIATFYWIFQIDGDYQNNGRGMDGSIDAEQ